MKYLNTELEVDRTNCLNKIGGRSNSPTAIVKYLKEKGYQYIHIGYSSTVINDKFADKIFMYKEELSLLNNDFVKMLVPMPTTDKGREAKRLLARDVTQFQLDTLGSLAPLERPSFIYCHMISPHHNYFMFRANGSYPTTGEMSVKGWHQWYLEQLTYMNRQLEGIVAAILENSSRPVVIVIQSDEGFSSNQYFELKYAEEFETLRHDKHILKERAYILNAYYLPEEYDCTHLSKSPVNTFRLIFNEYLEGEFELLPDRFYFMKRISAGGQSMPLSDIYDATEEALGQ